MTTVRTTAAELDQRRLQVAARASSARRSTAGTRPTAPLDAELRSSLLLLLGVLGLPLLLVLLAAA